ncbi:MAG: DUF3883 domain-containing protein [Planctomycetota bacterium]
MKLPDNLRPLDRGIFESIRVREFRPGYDLTGLKHLRDKAQTERNLRELYRNRAPYELLQNADDAQASAAAFILLRDGLLFVHNGKWFTVGNFRSLADGWSDKNPDECIGHKGLGFRAVLDITPCPHLIKADPSDWFAVKFSYGLNKGHIDEAVRREPSLRSHYEEWGKFGQVCCPVMAIPGFASKASLGAGGFILDELARGKYCVNATTIFWFPDSDSSIDKTALEALDCSPLIADQRGRQTLLNFLTNETRILLPLLNSLRQVRLYEGGSQLGMVRLDQTSRAETDQIAVTCQVGNETTSTAHFLRFRWVSAIPQDVKNATGTPKAVRYMTHAKAALSVRLSDGQPIPADDALIHVYFPTDERTGLGCIVHGDFFVAPDRKHLMPGKYNEWLLSVVAETLANGFLSALLDRFHPGAVFAALAPTWVLLSDVGRVFVRGVESALQQRKSPFLPTKAGSRRSDGVLLGPTLHQMWESHFADAAQEWPGNPRAFLAHAADGPSQRRFLAMAGIKPMEPEAIFDLMRIASRKPRPAQWWYECFCHFAQSELLGRLDAAQFLGRGVIPLAYGSVHTVRKDERIAVCLPPGEAGRTPMVPQPFASVFVFIDPELASSLNEGSEAVRDWVIDRHRLTRFETTELIPKAVRAKVQEIFSGELRITARDLEEIWTFVRDSVPEPRAITSQTFWDETGRLPLPVAEIAGDEEQIQPGCLVPAFLAFWPDGFSNNRALVGVLNRRKVHRSFLDRLTNRTHGGADRWKVLFEAAGVTAGPKSLRYRRIAAGAPELNLVACGVPRAPAACFSGERQQDENRVVVEGLRGQPWWPQLLAEAQWCGHSSSKVLQSLELIDGFSECCETAVDEYSAGNPLWKGRLLHLVKDLKAHAGVGGSDTGYCRGSGATGHSFALPSYVMIQRRRSRFLPSSLGPSRTTDCFARLSSKRLISAGGSGEEIGDQLLPYVVADSLEELAALQRLGVEVLEDAESATPAALVGVLEILGTRLASAWGEQEILQSRPRWRLVRGAIQEIYRALNRVAGGCGIPHGLKLASKLSGKVQFREGPLYYAEPGSVVERAFKDMLPLIDADRLYEQLFTALGVTHLALERTVQESVSAEEATGAVGLQAEIQERLSPFLLAPLVAQGQQAARLASLIRRLRERFQVMRAAQLSVSLSLTSDPSVGCSVQAAPFYMRHTVLPGTGATQETHYTLFVVSDAQPELRSLDADALGEALSPLFTDGFGSDAASLFPRIVTRYQRVDGDRHAMSEFLLRQLHISLEAQEEAFSIVAGGETVSGPPEQPVPPPPAHIVPHSGEGTPASGQPVKDLLSATQVHEEKVREKAATVVRNLIQPARAGREREGPPPLEQVPADPVSREQRDRGRRGEDEIRRRLLAEDGWEGFTLVNDVRDQRCGYDFLCRKAGRKVKLEVKTFTENGRVILTARELQEAATGREDYNLIGVLDDGGPANWWRTVIVRDPLPHLLALGEFEIEATLGLPAAVLFGLASRRSHTEDPP